VDCFASLAMTVRRVVASGTNFPVGIEADQLKHNGGSFMGRYLLLWMLGIPLPILVLIYAFGGLH